MKWSILVVALCLCARIAQAAGTPDDPRAREFFEVGVQAYDRDEYLLAIEAFRQAYKIVPRPGLLFSIAQAEQRQYRATGERRHLSEAIEHYQRYLKDVTTGGRRQEALASLKALQPIAERLPPEPPAEVEARREPAAALGRILISSLTAGTRVTVNGELLGRLPGAVDLPDGQYRVEASAPGFQKLVHQIDVVTGAVIPLNLQLEALSARLQVAGTERAELFVDSKPVGSLPLAPLSLPAGKHTIALRKRGSRSLVTQVNLERGETERLQVDLASSWQRDLTWGMGIGGAVTGVTALSFAAAAAVNGSRAEELEDERNEGSLDASQASTLNAAVQRRDRFRTVAIVSGSVSLAALATALVLYLVDDPAVPGAAPTPLSNSARPFVAAGPGEAGVSTGFVF